ncbi:MAG: hypothetical protein JL50_07860 [Peptococcaceae bacterium BICA1-7]|nr:MAG: hypothetical protein JL50_07860 [Peptococcaceae bacterium BICA1-7]HBV97527.1 hypothetical protein [Desulfotomaculum sp.]
MKYQKAPSVHNSLQNSRQGRFFLKIWKFLWESALMTFETGIGAPVLRILSPKNWGVTFYF